MARLKCEHCGGVESRIVDSRETDQLLTIVRRRECKDCGFRVSTHEISIKEYNRIRNFVGQFEKIQESLNELEDDIRSGHSRKRGERS